MNTIQMAAKIYEARDQVKAMWPDRWREVIKGATDHIRTIMKRDSCDEVKATLTIAKVLRDTNDLYSLTFYLAACCEMCEPTP